MTEVLTSCFASFVLPAVALGNSHLAAECFLAEAIESFEERRGFHDRFQPAQPSSLALAERRCRGTVVVLVPVRPDGDLAARAPSPWCVGKPGHVAVLSVGRLPQNVPDRFDVADV